ncbi:hypothetical protein EBR03_09190 [bacterium]|nr:hypothetical protein [bacterium]NBW99733.1 hypothetical protein [bacterium]NBX83173.1 hypothetical protein [bacterium]
MTDKKEMPEQDESEIFEKEKPWWSELVKDVTAAGLATIFMTEEGVRGYLKEKKLPKELIGLLIDGFSKKKDNLYEMLTREFGKVLSKTDINREFQRFLENHEMEVHAKVSFKKKEKHHEKSDQN